MSDSISVDGIKDCGFRISNPYADWVYGRNDPLGGLAQELDDSVYSIATDGCDHYLFRNPQSHLIADNCLDILPRLAKETVDLIYYKPVSTSWIKYLAKVHKMPHKDYLEFTYESLDALVGLLSLRGSLWANVNEEIAEDVVAHAEKLGLHMRHRVAWSYSFGPCGSDDVLTSKLHTLCFVKNLDNHIWGENELLFDPGFPSDCLKSDRAQDGQVQRCPKYPGQLPQRYLQQIIRACTDEESFVLSPFLGRGEMCIAARAMGRRVIGIDVSEARVISVAAQFDVADEDKLKISKIDPSNPD